MVFTCTATTIPFIHSFSGNCAASAPISIFMCLWAIYIFPGSVLIFPLAEKADPSWEYNSLTDTWMWKLGLRPRYSFSEIICFKFSAFCLCSVVELLCRRIPQCIRLFPPGETSLWEDITVFLHFLSRGIVPLGGISVSIPLLWGPSF